jgi:hypothetical protein
VQEMKRGDRGDERKGDERNGEKRWRGEVRRGRGEEEERR